MKYVKYRDRVRPTADDKNVTSEDKISKFSINLPYWMRDKIKEVTTADSVFCGRESTFIRMVIAEKLASMEHNEERLATQEEVAEIEKSGTAYEVPTQALCPNPPRKYHGFGGGRLRNSFVKKGMDRLAEALLFSKKSLNNG